MTLDLWQATASALDLRLAADLVDATPSDPDGRLWRLIEESAERGGWSTHRAADDEIRLSRRPRREAAALGLWDVIGDVDASIDQLSEAMALETARRPADWRIGGVVVIRSSGPNRRRMSEARDIVDETFPDSGTRWMTALVDPRVPMPGVPAFCWASGNATRLTPARLPLIRPVRVPRA